MGDQLNYLNNLNKANLVDLSLLQKINEGYQHSAPKSTYIYSLVQKAGSVTCGLAKDNIFITVVVACLVLFLVWCYIEKQRQNALYEKYLQKKLAKSLLSDELNLFTQVPEPLNMDKLFVDINDEMKEPEIQKQENTEKVEYTQVEPTSSPVHLTKRESNLKIYDANQRKPDISNQEHPISGNPTSSKYMSMNDFNGSYMLM
jgi:hypothetical protein